MNIITQTQAFEKDVNEDKSVAASAEGVIPLQSTDRHLHPIVASDNRIAPDNNYYDIFQRPSQFQPQRTCCNTPRLATTVKAHKRRQRSAKKSPAFKMRVDLPMEECDRKVIAALKTQQLFEIKARFASNC
jgi:hypothetical protein